VETGWCWGGGGIEGGGFRVRGVSWLGFEVGVGWEKLWDVDWEGGGVRGGCGSKAGKAEGRNGAVWGRA
jgi:hypothetical protein